MRPASSTCGGKIVTSRPYRARTWSGALRAVAVEATSSGRTGRPVAVAPGREDVDGDLEQAHGGAQRAGDEVQLVLDDQVRRPQPAHRANRRGRRTVLAGGCLLPSLMSQKR